VKHRAAEPPLRLRGAIRRGGLLGATVTMAWAPIPHLPRYLSAFSLLTSPLDSLDATLRLAGTFLNSLPLFLRLTALARPFASCDSPRVDNFTVLWAAVRPDRPARWPMTPPPYPPRPFTTLRSRVRWA